MGAFRNSAFNHGLRINYAPSLALHRSEHELLQNSNIVRQMQIEDEVSQANPDELRWRVITNTSLKALPLSTQRNRLRRRWKAAFQQSLKKQGLARNGKKDASQIHMPHTPELAGTLELVIFEGYGFDEDARELTDQTNKVVRELLRAGEKTRRTTLKSNGTKGGRSFGL